MDLQEVQERIVADKIDTLRIEYPDVYGVCRSKAMPAAKLASVAEHGINFAKAVYAIDLSNNIPPGTGVADEIDWRDMAVIPDLDTYTPIPYLPGTARLLADPMFDGKPSQVCPRNLLKRVVNLYKDLNLRPMAATELEFFLFRLENGQSGPYYANQPDSVYTTGPRVDEMGILRNLQNILMAMGLDVLYMNHEFFSGQYEINWKYDDALAMADQSFTYKTVCKDYAAQQGLHLTFMDRPKNEGGGSGYHVHFSVNDPEGTRNLFDDPQGKHGLSELALNFIAGQMAHAKSMTPFMLSTINSYRRVCLDSFAPYFLVWGLDNRTVYLRVPGERGRATRCENRGPGASANPYLVIAAGLLAGLDGIRNKMDPGDPFLGDAYRLDPETTPTVPQYMPDALAALKKDAWLCEAMGTDLVQCFLALKEGELERFRTYVTDWEWNEYSRHL
ncbi:MAG: glutamine synthetase family protein [Deltaproteobacteria bacterium]|nr:glutamine synthetase family protein [Deltaproteobacteria bacterium]